MDDFLLPVGSIVEICDPDDLLGNYIIIGHRIVNYDSMRAWDYISVEYPKGLTRNFKNDKTLDCDNYFYFNHYEIENVIYKNELKLKNNI